MADTQAKRIVLVAGATGQQGGGVVEALLRQGRFAVRALTRNPDSDKAKALAARGVEVVQGEMTDKASIAKAMSAARAVFWMTDAFSSTGHDAKLEVEMGQNGVDAALDAGIQHFVWSGLEDVRKVPGVKVALPEIEEGRLVPHFEAKAEVTAYLEKSGVPYTVLLTSIFYENWLGVFPFVKQEDGSFAFYANIGAEKHAIHAVLAIGDTVAEVLANREKYIGKTVPVTAEHISFTDVATAISEVTGKTVKYVDVPLAASAAAGFPGAADIANMFEYYKIVDNYNELRPVERAVVNAQGFKDWAADHKDALLAALQ